MLLAANTPGSRASLFLRGIDHELLLEIAKPVVVFLVVLFVLQLLRRYLLRWLYTGSGGPQTLRHVATDTIRVPSILWCLAAALHWALAISAAPQKYTERASNIIIIFLVLSFSIVVSSVSVRMLTMYGMRRGMAFAVSGLARTLIRVSVFSFGVLILLWIFDKQITPLLTALGVGGLAVALALQDTLGNFFAGIHILLEEPIAVGHFIRLSEQDEGVVTDIGWRTTRVRNGRNNMIVIPNTKITSGILTNFSLPEPRVAVELAIHVGHDADPDHVIKIALEEAKSTEHVLPDPAPRVFFNPGVLPTHTQMTLVCNVLDFTRQIPVLHELRLRLLRRMRAEGVPLPKVETAVKG